MLEQKSGEEGAANKREEQDSSDESFVGSSRGSGKRFLHFPLLERRSGGCIWYPGFSCLISEHIGLDAWKLLRMSGPSDCMYAFLLEYGGAFPGVAFPFYRSAAATFDKVADTHGRNCCSSLVTYVRVRISVHWKWFP